MDTPAPVGMDALLAHRDWVRALARFLVADPAAAEDLEQQAWLEALRRPPSHGGALKAWFGRVLRRRAADARRERFRRSLREEAAARPEARRSTADVVAEAEAHRRVVEAVMSLEEPYRETVLLRFFEDLPPAAVGARLGVPAETVRTRTRRALDRLRERLDAGSGGDRTTWVAALVPLTGARWESAAIAGGAAMASKAAVGAAAAAAVLGGLAGGFAVRGGGSGRADLADAREEIAALRGRVDELEARPAPVPAVTPVVEERMAGLQRRVEVLEAAPPPGTAAAAASPTESPGSPARVVETPEQRADRERRAKESQDALEKGKKALGDLEARVEELRRRALDRTLAEDERVLALQKLRYLPNGINADVIQGMTAFFRETAQASTRDALLRELHNTKTDDVKALFLEALRSDPDEKVRVRAAGDIDTWRDDPAVVQALEAAVFGDSSEAVRKRAARTLVSEGKKD